MDLTILPVDSPFPGKIFYTPSTGSTMELARNLVENQKKAAVQNSDIEEGTVFMAGEQTQGRGRLPARNWQSPQGENLLFTAVFSKTYSSIPILFFPLASGLAVAKALEKAGFDPRIKWPNDVLINRKKVCGILCESMASYLTAGIGLNCNQREFDPRFSAKATSLYLLSGKTWRREDLLSSILFELHQLLLYPAWKDELAGRLYGRQEPALFRERSGDDQPCLRGRVEGIGGEGQLLFRTDEGRLLESFSGELLYDVLPDFAGEGVDFRFEG